MTSLLLLIDLVLMLVVANGAPIAARHLLGSRGTWPIDGGHRGRDGNRLLGPSKTWRGMLAAIIATMAVGALIGLGGLFGAVFGACAMAGDLASSYLKRRRGLAASSRATGLDQLPEALLPMVFSHWWLEVGWLVVIAASCVFFLLVTQLSPLLYRLGIRQRPH